MPTTPVAVHAFPECKDIWARLDPVIQEQLLSQSSRTLDASGIEPGESIPVESLHELESEGVLIQEDEKWRFASPQMLFFIQSIVLIDSLALHSQATDELIQNLVDLLRTAHSHSRDRYQEYKDLVSVVIAQLVNEFGRLDVLDSLASEETPHPYFWQLYEPACNAFPILALSVEGFAAIFKRIADRERGDLAGGKIYSAAEYLGSLRPKFAFELVDYLATAEEWQAVGFLERLLTGIALTTLDHFDAIVTKGEEWLNSGIDNLCQAALYCFQNLILKDRLDPNRLISRADSLALKTTDQVRYALSLVITALGANFEKHAEGCLDILRRLKEKEPSDRVVHGIAGTLSHTRGNVGFGISCLSLLTDVPTDHKGTIWEISWLLYPIAQSHPAQVWRYLEEWILAHGLEESIIEHNMFLTPIQEAYRCDSGLATSVLTRWFSAPDLRLVEQVRPILRELNVRSFAATEIRSMPNKTVIYITEKLLLIGRLEGIQTLWLFYSILRNATEVEELKDYFSSALWYLAWNYPGGAQEFFDQAIREEDTTEASLLLRRVRQELEQYQEQRKEIFVAELSPSKRRVMKFLEYQKKQQQRIQETMLDDDRYPLQRLLARVAIGRGDRTFHMNVLHLDATQRRTFSEPSGFGEFFASVELPRGSFLDPEGESWARFRRLHLKLDDILGEGD